MPASCPTPEPDLTGGDGLDTLRIYGDSRSLGTARLDAMSSIEIIDLTNIDGFILHQRLSHRMQDIDIVGE